MSEQDTNFTARSATAVHERVDKLNPTLSQPDENTVKLWLLFTGNRLVVSGVLLAGVFAAFIGATTVNPVNMRDLLTETTTLTTLFSVLLSGTILLVSIVVSISSVALSQELTDIENQQERINAAIEYRKQVEGFIEEDILPAHPAGFLLAVLSAMYRTNQDLESIAEESTNSDFQIQVDSFVEQVTSDIEQAQQLLDGARFGSFRVLLVGLTYNYAGQLHAVRALKQEFEETLTDKEEEVIDDLIDTLKFFATGSEFIKSIYYKRELAQLTNRLLYVSLPVIVFTSYILLALNADLIPEMVVFGVSPLVVFVGFAYTVALTPYIVLTTYVLRVTTVTLRTLASGPFILPSGSKNEGFDWDLTPDDHEGAPSDRRAE